MNRETGQPWPDEWVSWAVLNAEGKREAEAMYEEKYGKRRRLSELSGEEWRPRPKMERWGGRLRTRESGGGMASGGAGGSAAGVGCSDDGDFGSSEGSDRSGSSASASGDESGDEGEMSEKARGKRRVAVRNVRSVSQKKGAE